MRKVAVIAPNSLPIPPVRGGGLQTVVYETVKLYKNYQPIVFSNSEWKKDTLPLREIEGNIEHRRIHQSPWDEFKIKFKHFATKNYFPYVYEIISQIKEIRPEIIHIHNRPWFLPIFRKYLGASSKIILHHHNNYFSEMSYGKVNNYLKMLDAFAGISNFTVSAEVANRFPLQASKCFTVYNGINTDKFIPKWQNEIKGKEIRKKYGLADDDIVIVFAGRLRKEKGIHTLLKAMQKIVPNDPKVKLFIVGSHFYMANNLFTPFMRGLVRSAEPIKQNVIFTGFIMPDQMPDIYAASDILVVPSHEDAFGLTYAEAGACGLPVIGSIVGGIPEIVDNADTGMLLENPENVDELVQLMNYLIQNPKKLKPMGERGRLKIERHFSVANCAIHTEEMYDKVLQMTHRSI